MISVDPQVYKLKDSRVTKLKQNRITIDQFLLCIRFFDWFMVLNNTIYAMSQSQYYSYYAPKLQQPRLISLSQLNDALDQQITAQDKHQLANIKNKLIGCSTCTFKKYADKATAIVKKYPELVSKYRLQIYKPILFKYPEVTQPIIQKISKIYPINYSLIKYTRKPCFDCVGKHLGSAYIKAIQVIQGYTQHNVLSLADLQQAYQECPAQCTQLRNLIRLCISKSIRDGIIFIPLQLLARQLQKAKQTVVSDSIAFEQNKPAQQLIIQLDAADKDILRNIQFSVKQHLAYEIDQLITTIQSSSQNIKLLWSGYMARIAQLLMPYSTRLSQIVRNRRLLFKQMPQATIGTQFNCSDILNQIRTVDKR